MLREARESAGRPKTWIVWSQHWVGYKPRPHGTYSTEQEAVQAAKRLNDSPSGEWFNYSVEARRT